MLDNSARRHRCAWALLVVGSLVLAPAGAFGADHRDSPLTKANAQLDINDVYIFKSSTNPNNTVIIVTVVPLAGVLNAPVFSSTGLYEIKVSNDGDAIEDVTFRFAFSAPNFFGQQSTAVQMITPKITQVVGKGVTGIPITSAIPGVRITTGLFDDPFFFDLNAFNDLHDNGNLNAFCHPGVDFFKGLNTLALVMEVPSALLQTAPANTNIGVWARTLDQGGHQIDRMGRPAINTALIPAPGPANPTFNKDTFNTTLTSNDTIFRPTVIATLRSFNNPLAYSTTLAGILLPDILTFNTSSSNGFLNGRKLTDDVIDIEFKLLLNNLGITTDCVSNDSAFLGGFPYLAAPNPTF
jgi:hypothetical protein